MYVALLQKKKCSVVRELRHRLLVSNTMSSPANELSLMCSKKLTFVAVTVRYIHLVYGCMQVLSKKRLIKIHTENFRLVLHAKVCSRLFSVHRLHNLFLFSGFVSTVATVSTVRFASRAWKQTTNEYCEGNNVILSS
jgi:hypothetical protein